MPRGPHYGLRTWQLHKYLHAIRAIRGKNTGEESSAWPTAKQKIWILTSTEKIRTSQGEAGRIPFGMNSLTKHTNSHYSQQNLYFSHQPRTQYKLLFGWEKVPTRYLGLWLFKTNKYQGGAKGPGQGSRQANRWWVQEGNQEGEGEISTLSAAKGRQTLSKNKCKDPVRILLSSLDFSFVLVLLPLPLLNFNCLQIGR